MKTKKVWFITGAAKGLGFDIVKAVLLSGDMAIATTRSKPEELEKKLGNNLNLLVTVMDVTNENDVHKSVIQGIAKFGRIDVLVNNAGYGVVTAIEEATDAETRRQYDTNVFGLLNVVRSVVPYMRKERNGHIINISSLFGYDAIPGWGLYGSTKFAVEGISKGLAVELNPFNIKVTALAPGLFRTEFLSTESYATSSNTIHDYDNTAVGEMKLVPEKLHGNQQGDPKKLAQVVIELADEKQPPLHLPVGKDSLEAYRKNTTKTNAEVEFWANKFTPTEL